MNIYIYSSPIEEAIRYLESWETSVLRLPLTQALSDSAKESLADSS